MYMYIVYYYREAGISSPVYDIYILILHKVLKHLIIYVGIERS